MKWQKVQPDPILDRWVKCSPHNNCATVQIISFFFHPIILAGYHLFLQEITLLRQEGEKLGMHIKGGLRGQRGNPLDKNDEGVFITKINSGGAAKRDGRLKVST